MAQFAGHKGGTGRTGGDLFPAAHRDFTCLHMPRYNSRGTYDATEEWPLSMQETLHLARSPAEFHTELTATLFDGDAQYWWTAQQPQYEGGPSIPCEWFTDAFCACFMGRAQLRALRQSFESFTQDNMTVR